MARLRPRRSARLRLTALSGSFFLVSGGALVATTYALFERATAFEPPPLPKIPATPAIRLQPSLLLGGTLPRLEYAQHQLARAAAPLVVRSGAKNFAGPLSLALKPVRQQLARAEHQLAVARNQLTQAVHQVAEAGSIQAAQRAADSHQLLVNSAIALGLVAVLALVAGWLVSGRILRPIRTITRAARRISSASLHERLALEGPNDELKQLGDTLDDLLARLEAAFSAQRHFVANASHELRTPIARERTLIEVALGDPSTPPIWRSTAQALLTSNREQETLIEALLALASSEGGLERREATDLSDLCRAVLTRLGQDGEDLGLAVTTDLSSAPLEGDPRLVERLVANLVDNAIGHNVAGGAVAISTTVSDDRSVLRVTNTGPVIPPEAVGRLFQPFQRLTGRGTRLKRGHGLGLSIVRAIAAAHGAGITALALPGGGLSVEIAFPHSFVSANSVPSGSRPLVGARNGRPTSTSDTP